MDIIGAQEVRVEAKSVENQGPRSISSTVGVVQIGTLFGHAFKNR